MSLSPSVVRRARALRATHPYIPTQTAVRIARSEYMTFPAPWAFLDDLVSNYGPDRATGTVGGLSVEVEIVSDPDSHIGEDDVTGRFVDAPGPNTIPNTVAPRLGAHYELSTVRAAETWQAYSRMGMSRSVARAAQDAARQDDMVTDADRDYVGVCVTLSVEGTEVGSESVWGIDLTGNSDRSYLAEVAADLISECLSRLRSETTQTIADAARRVVTLADALGALDKVSDPAPVGGLWAS